MTSTSTDRETVESLAQLADAWGEMKLAAGQEYASDDMARFADTLRALLGERDAALVRAEKAEAEVERLVPWARLGVVVMEEWPEIGDIDGLMLQDMAVNCGVLQEIPGGYDPEQHFDSVGVAPERGDPWFEIIAVPPDALKDGGGDD